MSKYINDGIEVYSHDSGKEDSDKKSYGAESSE